ncbi:hypothetical protein CONPUDRAFT_137239 [Coniophora puteana RWD-64-598 SS2]|uniref:F-box domain-containing protein n=1 Tax=Coniophora puteana (strain RWD-64-598) TaxID=741705 RepID=A0A5M3MQ46_CONPW|nr:uncharacterized protein CONPUDRAFT_137239 [Coniophora puteana RWD-64-598 SS2]EIW81177.1 hypothetical protein CONPUDRAFT_137239 [Coniophora puteana RWD-64-598 SS2]
MNLALQLLKGHVKGVRGKRSSHECTAPVDLEDGSSNSELHPWTRIPHILEAICAYLNDIPSLARLARVCVAFNEPTLDALYANIEDFIEFLKCLPRDLWILKDLKKPKETSSECDPVKEKVLHFRRKMTRNDWDSFMSKSVRVKTMGPPLANAHRTLHSSPKLVRGLRVQYKVGESVLGAFAERPISIPFPKLRQLTGGLPTSVLSAVLSPSLRHLDITYSNLEDLDGDSAALAALCPSLESLHLVMPFPAIRSDLLSQYVQRLEHLHSLTGWLPAPQTILEILRERSKLGALELVLFHGHHYSTPDKESHLHEVDSLALEADSYEHVLIALDIMFKSSPQPSSGLEPPSFPVVRSLSVRAGLNESALYSLVSPLPRLISHSALMDLHITHILIRSEDDHPPLHEALRQLTVFHNLTALTVEVIESCPAEDQLSGSQLSELVSHWPLLEKLRIIRPRDSTTMLPKDPTSMLDLAAILRACPHLRNVYVDVLVHPDDVLALSEMLDPSERFENLRYLALQHYTARYTDVEPIAYLSASCAPFLAHIYTWGTWQKEFWKLVAAAASVDRAVKCRVDIRPCREMTEGLNRFP